MVFVYQTSDATNALEIEIALCYVEQHSGAMQIDVMFMKLVMAIILIFE